MSMQCQHSYQTQLIISLSKFSLQYNFKKLRNNIEKSKAGGVRHLGKGESGQHIEWEHFKKAYEWDQKHSTLKIHERLSEEHFSLGYANKMRNHLACDVLNKNMLFLMKVRLKYYY